MMLSFTRSVESYWPLIYCVGCTITHAAFCLGMVYKMDPFRMPYNFCVVQSVFIAIGAFLMTGVSAAFAIATTFAALKPKTWVEGGKGVMIWRRIYILPLVVFPALASALQIVITLRFDSGVRFDDMHCDYSHPWIRFFSYAGVPWIITIPCFYLSIRAITRILKTNKHLQRSRDPDMAIETFTPRRPKHIQMARAISASSSSPASNLRSSIQSSSPALTSATLTTRVHHMPFEPPALGFESLNAQSSRPMSQVSTELDSPVSSSFPRFADPPPASSSTSIDRERITVESTSPTPGEDWREILGAAPESPDPDKASSLRWGGDGDKSEFDHPKGSDFFVEDDESGTYTNRPVSRSMGTITRRRRPLPTLTPAVYRIISFQLAFTIVQPLSSISTFIDIARHKTPPPFGTQHIAFLMSAWGPVFIFMKWPNILKRFSLRLPWK